VLLDVLHTLIDASPSAAVFIISLAALGVVAIALSKIPGKRP
jgi:hypothetical protein